MAINLKNFLFSQSKNSKIRDFQDLDHIDGLAISAISAKLYKHERDDVVIFYFRDGANFGSVYTQSKIFSENSAAPDIISGVLASSIKHESISSTIAYSYPL